MIFLPHYKRLENNNSFILAECESAADSICILTRGKKHCEGTAEELKAQYGKFYSVTIKVPEHSKEGGDNSSPVTNASASDCHLSEDAETAKKIRGSSETTTPRNVIEATVSQQNWKFVKLQNFEPILPTRKYQWERFQKTLGNMKNNISKNKFGSFLLFGVVLKLVFILVQP